MLSQLSMLPFPIGQTWGEYFRTVTSTTDGIELEGLEFDVPDYDYSQTLGSQIFKARAYGNGAAVAMKTIRVVRNTSGVAILPRYLVKYDTAHYGRRVNGYANVTAEECYPADEFLRTAGVPANDLFYITVYGPAECITDPAAGANDVFSAGSVLVSLTAAASTTSTTAGRVAPQDLTGATAVLGVQLQNRIGIALSASTTANSSAAKLVFIKWH